MKKLPLLIFLATITFTSFGQEQKAGLLRLPTLKDRMLAGANLLLLCGPDELEPNSSREHYNAGINPRFGYFILDNLALGIDLKVSFNHSGRYNSKKVYTRFGAFGRYYAGKAVHRNGTINKLRFFVDAGAAYGQIRFMADDYFDGYDILYLHIMPGINYFLKPGIALEFGLNGTFEFIDNRDTPNFIYSPNLGIQFFFAGR